MQPGYVRKCIEHICEQCGYDSAADFADALGESRQTVNNWQERNTWGRSGPGPIHDLTGANPAWLIDRPGAAFPDGPKINPKLQPATLYKRIRGLETLVITFVVASLETTPKLADPLSERLAALDPELPALRGMLASLKDELQQRRPPASHAPRHPKAPK